MVDNENLIPTNAKQVSAQQRIIQLSRVCNIYIIYKLFIRSYKQRRTSELSK